MKNLILIIIFFFSNSVVCSQNYTISGYVTDRQTGEQLVGATIYSPVLQKGSQTNSFGFYSLTLPVQDSILIQISYVGYNTVTNTFVLNKNKIISFELISGITTQNVVVNGNSIDKTIEMGKLQIPVKQLDLIPTLGAEPDLMKAFQLMPGVQSGNEGSSGLYVRGGSPDQNLILLDDVPLYYVNHLGGFVSIFNTDAINSVSLTKGSFPARYGGRLSSVMDVRMKEGNMKKVTGNVTLGTVTSKISIQGPVKRDVSSFIFSARGLLWGFVYQPLMRILLEDMSIGYNFYDINAKYNHKLNKNNRVYFSFYYGDDNLIFNVKENMFINDEKAIYTLRWGNLMTAVRWNKVFSQKLFSNLTFSYTRYRYVSDFSYTNKIEKEYINYNYYTGINDFNFKYEFDYYVNSNYKIKTGTEAIFHNFNPGVTKTISKIENTTEHDTTIGNKSIMALENTYYFENEIKIGKRFTTNIGLRMSNYFINNKYFFSFEPRIINRFSLNKTLSIKASYSKTQQNIHLLTSSTVGMPVDIWVPATAIAKPSQSQQVAFGVFKSTFDNTIEISIETYYKELSNLIAYKEGVSYQGTSQNWQEKIETNGKGTSYGIELLIQKKAGVITGWLGYTYAKTYREFENINNGNKYPFKYDRTHDLSLVVNYKVNKKINLSASWVFGSGYPYTLPRGKYPIINDNQDWLTANLGFNYLDEVYIWEDRNSRRMRSFHHLDFGMNFKKQKKRGIRTWTISVYNVYNRQNPYFYYMNFENNEWKLFQQSLFPVIPSISYSFKF